jgi:glutamate dehydrogenase/leucine dehydrogenase
MCPATSTPDDAHSSGHDTTTNGDSSFDMRPLELSLGLQGRCAFRTMWERHLERNVDLRTAAYMVGVDRVAEAVRLRGLA